MGFTLSFMKLAIILPGLLIASAPPAVARASSQDRDFDTLATKYLGIWGGDMSLVESVIHPKITLIADRLPASVGSSIISVSNMTEYVAFVGKSRAGWADYSFNIIHSVGKGNQMAIRWKMNGITSANMTLPTTLETGSAVTYNGTDFIILDDCTGLIKEVHMAQDFITFFHELGLTSVTV
ncbi:hypothetical protein B0J13DRAFT_623876 [Dactylonectria estremocensis]|uniref:SnoaL-like domain-containing protein n=1 Tax=Dactylonectria estremocensis TaxID=1079267 RepID=A0A9P9J494_9HYPO|nr:hypothetical protein B0J13DRAFT_623876 [Dactylonectria estremocensis]